MCISACVFVGKGGGGWGACMDMALTKLHFRAMTKLFHVHQSAFFGVGGGGGIYM